MSIVVSILIILVILGLLVTAHELGHFWVASWLKIKAFEVSIFVGPKLLQWKRKGVEYTIRAIPLGAYVRFSEFDDEGNVIKDDDPALLINQKRWKRLLVALAGPFMNLVLGVLIFVILFAVNPSWFMTLDTDETAPYTQMAIAIENCPEYNEGDIITHVNGKRVFSYFDFAFEAGYFPKDIDVMTLTLKSGSTGESYEMVLDPVPVERPMMGFRYYAEIDEEYNGWPISEIYEDANNGSPVLKAGDILVAINDIPVVDDSIYDFCDSLHDGDTVTFTFYRDGVEHHEDSVVNTLLVPSIDYRGIYLTSHKINSVKEFFVAIKTASATPLSVGRITVSILQNALKGSVEPYNVVQGPVGLTASVSEVVTENDTSVYDKVSNLIMYSAMISLGLMYSNMLPIPGLDGNQVILLIVEAVIGRPISRKAEDVIAVVGFIMLILLAVFALASDIIRIVIGA